MNVSSLEQKMLNKICKAKLEINEIINKKSSILITKTCLQYFEHGNKSGRFLPNLLKMNKKMTICAAKDGWEHRT